MKIDIGWSVDHYRAECKDLPGMSPAGLGDTKEMAVACLFWRMLFDGIGDRRYWADYLDPNEPIIVDGKTWAWPESYRDR